MKSSLGYDNRHTAIQAFPLQKGKISLGGGDHGSIGLVHCVEDGALTLTYADSSTEDLSMAAGEDYILPTETDHVTIISGVFHLA